MLSAMRAAMVAALFGLGCTVEIEKFRLDSPEATCGVDAPLIGIYMPDPPVERMLAKKTAKTGNTLVMQFQYCVDPRGRVWEVEVLDDDAAPAIAELLGEEMLKWRFKPAIVDGQPITACVHQLLVVEFVRRSARADAAQP